MLYNVKIIRVTDYYGGKVMNVSTDDPQFPRYFVGDESKELPNYFQYVGNKLSELFLQKLAQEAIWDIIESYG